MNNGGPAFPEIDTRFREDGDDLPGPRVYSEGGMTLRDYFAAKAMQSALHPEFIRASKEARALRGDAFLDFIAVSAYKTADAMLRARGIR